MLRITIVLLGFPAGAVLKNLLVGAGDARNAGLIPALGKYPRGGNGGPLQYSCLGIPWTEDPDGLQPMGSQRVRHDWATNTALLLLLTSWRHITCSCACRMPFIDGNLKVRFNSKHSASGTGKLLFLADSESQGYFQPFLHLWPMCFPSPYSQPIPTVFQPRWWTSLFLYAAGLRPAWGPLSSAWSSPVFPGPAPLC